MLTLNDKIRMTQDKISEFERRIKYVTDYAREQGYVAEYESKLEKYEERLRLYEEAKKLEEEAEEIWID